MSAYKATRWWTAFASSSRRPRRPTRSCCARRCARWLFGLVAWQTVTLAVAGKKARPLLDLKDNVARGTKHRYGQAYLALQEWLWESQLPPMTWLATQPASLINEILMMYVQHLYDEKKAYTQGPFTLAAMQFFHRALHGQLRPAWQSVKAWKHAEPGELRAPVPLSVLWGLLGLAARHITCMSCRGLRRRPSYARRGAGPRRARRNALQL